MYHTSQDEENEPVHDQHRPEDRDVEDIEPAAGERDGDSASSLIPELELGQPADEWSKLLVLLGGETASGPILHLIIENIVRRVELGLQESEEQIEQVNAERIGHYASQSQ